MAETRAVTSGSMITGEKQGRSIRFDWWINKQSIEENYTEIGWQLVGDGSYTGTNNQGYVNCGPFDLWIAGTQFYKGDRLAVKKGDVVNSGTHRLYHDSVGNCSFTASLGCAIYSSSINTWSGDKTWDLPQIPRQATVTSATDFTDEGNPTIKFSNPGGFRINARLEFSGSIIRRDNISNTGTYTFDLTDEERQLLRQKCTGNSMIVREVIATCINDETEDFWSWQDKTMTIINANPEFNNFEFEDINEKTIALTGNNQNIIKGYSNIQVTIPVVNKAIAKKEAIMSKYRFTCGDKSEKEPMPYSDTKDVIGVIDGVPNGTFTVYATDSRNNSTPVQKLANEVIDYSPLTKGNIDINRNNGVSENVTLQLDGIINEVNFGLIINSIKSAIFRYRIANSSNEWKDQEIELTVSNGRFSFDGLVAGDLESKGFNISNSYEIEVVVKDELSSVTFTDKFGSGKPNIALHKNGVGIMKKYDTEMGGALQIGGSIDIDGEITVQGSSSPIYVGVKGDPGKDGAQGPQGIPGPQGNPGTDLKVLGVYETLEQLKQEHPLGTQGDVYLVDGFIYVWDISKSDWSKGGNIANVFGDTLPVGAITKYGGENVPNNWLLCDGSQYLKTDYPELYNAIGTYYNLDSDEGELYFRVPDFRERVGVGSNGDGEFGLGNTGGEKEHKLTTNEIPDLPVKFTNSNSVVLTKDGTVQTNLTSGYSRGAGKWDSGTDGELYADGGGQAHNNMPPYVAVNYIIKVKQSAGIVADVLNTKNSSETDTYSCDYINKMFLDKVYPVGSIYTSISETSPKELFGGTWEQIQGRFLLASGTPDENTDTWFGAMSGIKWRADVGSKGGQDYHKLTVDEMPAHKHDINFDQIWHTNGGQTSIGTTSGGPYNGVDFTKNTGGGQQHNNMPPYLAVNMWKRIA